MTKLTKVRSSGFKDQVSVGTHPSRHQGPASWVLPVWGEPFLGREALGACHLPRVLPPASCACSWLRAAPVLLLRRQEVRTGSELLVGFRLPGQFCPEMSPLSPGGWLSSEAPPPLSAGLRRAALLLVSPQGEPGPSWERRAPQPVWAGWCVGPLPLYSYGRQTPSPGSRWAPGLCRAEAKL